MRRWQRPKGARATGASALECVGPAVLCASSRCKWEESDGSLRRCPCPVGQGGAAVCGGDAVCPAGKGASEWRAGFWACRGREQFARRFAHQGDFPGAPGNGAAARFAANIRGRAVEISFPRPQKPNFLPFLPPLHSPAIPRGERRALPAPAQGSRPLRIPSWGTAIVFPHPPSPPTPQAAGPCSWACRRLFPLPPPSERNAASPPHS